MRLRLAPLRREMTDHRSSVLINVHHPGQPHRRSQNGVMVDTSLEAERAVGMINRHRHHREMCGAGTATIVVGSTGRSAGIVPPAVEIAIAEVDGGGEGSKE